MFSMTLVPRCHWILSSGELSKSAESSANGQDNDPDKQAHRTHHTPLVNRYRRWIGATVNKP